jgi:hypothetical protein
LGGGIGEQPERILKVEHHEFHESNGHQGLGSCHLRRRGGHRCRLAFGSIAIAIARESVEAG